MRLFNINTPNPYLSSVSQWQSSANTRVKLLFQYYLQSAPIRRLSAGLSKLPASPLEHLLDHETRRRRICRLVSSHACKFSPSRRCAPSPLLHPHIRLHLRLQTTVAGQKAGAASILKMHHIGQRVWATTLQEHYADRSPCWLSVSHFSGSVHP